MKHLGIKAVGLILNKAYSSYLGLELKHYIKSAFVNAGVELFGILPRIQL
jgi:hypothetical protein